MEIVLVRHGEPAWVANGLAVGDPDLTLTGFAQADRVADALGGARIDHLWVSTATRSRSTVAPLEQRLGREAEVHDWLHEIRNDVLSGRPANEVATIFREFRSNPVSDWWDGIPRCESGRGFVDRVTAGFDATFGALGARAVDQDGARRWTGVPEGRLVIVSHGGTSGVLIAHLLGMDQVPWPWERFGLLHASFARLEARPTAGAFAFGLTEFREIRHLTASLVTR